MNTSDYSYETQISMLYIFGFQVLGTPSIFAQCDVTHEAPIILLRPYK